MTKSSIWLAGALALALAPGCASVEVIPKNEPSRTHLYTVLVSAEEDRLVSRNAKKVRVNWTDAPAGLARGLRAAVIPPTRCVEAASPSRTRRECDVLISQLERELARDGFEIVGWRTLNENQPLRSASRLKLDVVFELDTLEAMEHEGGDFNAVSLSFVHNTFVTTASGSALESAAPLAVDKETGERCANRALRHMNTRDNGRLSMTLALRARRVADGVELWRYSNTVFGVDDTRITDAPQMHYALSGRDANERYPNPDLITHDDVTYTLTEFAEEQDKARRQARLGVALFALGAGLGVLTWRIAAAHDPENPSLTVAAGVYSGAAAIPLLLGGLFLVPQTLRQKAQLDATAERYNTQPPVTFEVDHNAIAKEFLCTSSARVTTGAPGLGTGRQNDADALSSTFSYSKGDSQLPPSTERIVKELFQTLSEDLASELEHARAQ